jgi:hypothetical protein
MWQYCWTVNLAVASSLPVQDNTYPCLERDMNLWCSASGQGAHRGTHRMGPAGVPVPGPGVASHFTDWAILDQNQLTKYE